MTIDCICKPSLPTSDPCTFIMFSSLSIQKWVQYRPTFNSVTVNFSFGSIARISISLSKSSKIHVQLEYKWSLMNFVFSFRMTISLWEWCVVAWMIFSHTRCTCVLVPVNYMNEWSIFHSSIVRTGFSNIWYQLFL